MAAPPRIVWALTAFVSLMLLCACDSDGQSGPSRSRLAEPNVPASDVVAQRGLAAVEEYISETKRWEEGSYRIRFDRREGANLRFWVIHSADREPGGGLSVEVEVDPTTNQVINEFRFQ